MSALTASGGTDANAPAMIPIAGKKRIRAFMRTPLGTAALVIQQYLKANSTAIKQSQLETGGPFPAEVDSGANGIPVVGELAGITLTNNHTAAQNPEVIVEVDDEDNG